MLFNSFAYFGFFAIAGTLVVLLRRRVLWRNLVLIAAGYWFYGQWDWRFLFLLLLTTILDYAAGLLLDDGLVRDEKDKTGAATLPPRTKRDRLILAASISSNLAILGFFKYFNFFADSATVLLAKIGVHSHPFVLNVILPVGISFYTFQSIAYVVDVYRRLARAERNPVTYAAYVAFFPQLVAGPIERIRHMGPQLRNPTTFCLDAFYRGWHLIGWGLFKKIVVADNMAFVVDSVFAHPAPKRSAALVAMYAFAIQIYCDFSGYTDIARGSARIMGFELLQNFDTPYLSRNPQEFWRRWHISLSTWLRDYLYVPLGGSRLGERRTYVNLIITMVLGGLWHGAAWTFVFWGLYHGMLLSIHRAISPWLARVTEPFTALGRKIWTVVSVVLCFHLVCIGWLLFRADSLEQFGRIGGALIGFRKWSSPPLNAWREIPSPWLAAFIAAALAMLAYELWHRATDDDEPMLRSRVPVRAVLYSVCILVFVLFGEFGGGRFIYFQF